MLPVRIPPHSFAVLICGHRVPIHDALNAILAIDGDFLVVDLSRPCFALRQGQCHEVAPRCVQAAKRRIRWHTATRMAGLGDVVAICLDAFGITKSRVQSLASVFGIQDCQCTQRQERLNKLPGAILALARRLGLPTGTRG